MALYSASPDPVALVTGFLLASAGVLFRCTVLLPQADGFVMLCRAQVPFLMVGGYRLTRSALASIGAGFTVIFVDATGIRATQVFDWAGILNDVLADLTWRVAGAGIAVDLRAGRRPLNAAAPARLCDRGLSCAVARPACATGDGAARFAAEAVGTARCNGRGVLDLREQMQLAPPPPLLREPLQYQVLPRLAGLF